MTQYVNVEELDKMAGRLSWMKLQLELEPPPTLKPAFAGQVLVLSGVIVAAAKRLEAEAKRVIEEDAFRKLKRDPDTLRW